MTGGYYFLITALPSLGDIGSAPPMGLGELAEFLGQAEGLRLLVETITLGDDLVQREALLAGEISEASPAVLTTAQLRDEEPLPDYLGPPADQDQAGRIPADALWAAYYHRSASVAAECKSPLLAMWVGFDVTLRNAFASARAKTLQLEPADYLVAPELSEEIDQFDPLINEWSSAPDPLAAMRVLDQARWRWLTDNDRWFSFDQDELVAYAAKLMLLNRWHRLATAQADQAPQPVANEADNTL